VQFVHASFNVEQIDGLPSLFYARANNVANPDARDAAAEAFFANLKADIRHGGNSAFYSPSEDRIQMPEFETFRDGASYYGTLSHEACHMTRHEKRLNRSFDQKRFGDSGYCREELVAELGSAFLCSDLGLAAEPREDHSSYIDHWLKVLKADSRAIFQAAAHAQRAVDFLSAMQPKPAS
jgi:antirestriction protein ArdC